MLRADISSDLRQIRFDNGSPVFQILPGPNLEASGLIMLQNGIWTGDSGGILDLCRKPTSQKAAENNLFFQIGGPFCEKVGRIMHASIMQHSNREESTEGISGQ